MPPCLAGNWPSLCWRSGVLYRAGRRPFASGPLPCRAATAPGGRIHAIRRRNTWPGRHRHGQTRDPRLKPLATLRKLARRTEAGAAGVVALIVILIWAFIGLHLRQIYWDAEDDGWRDGANLARVFSENVARSFAAIDQMLLFARESYLRDPNHFDLSTWATHGQLVSEITFQISVLGPDGKLLLTNHGPVTNPVDLSDREHFVVQRDAIEDRVFISKPVLGRVSNRWSLNTTRRITRPDGSFGGVVVVSVDPYYFSSVYETLDLQGASLILIGTDGVIRSRAPTLDGVLGTEIDTNGPAAVLRTGADHGNFRALSRFDNVERLVSFRRVPGLPLIVGVGLATNIVFAQYERDRLQYLIAGSALTALTIVAGAALAQQQRRVAQSQAALNGTVENVTQGVLMVAPDGTVPVVNRRAVELLGLPPDLMARQPTFAEITAWQVQNSEFGPSDQINPELQRMLRDDLPVNDLNLYERVRPNGTALEIRTRLLPDGTAVRTYTDITARRANEEALAAARDAAEAAGRARSEFLAVMSHEIRTPLNGILGVAGLLLDMTLGATERHYVRTIMESGNHLLQLINDILDITRLEAGRVDLEELEFDPRVVVRNAIEMLAPEASFKRLELRLDVADDVPSRVIGDSSRLRQVLLNLVGNGVKFTNTGGVHVAVTRVRDEPGGVRLGFAIADTGIGIPAEAQGKLFTEFTQVDSSISRRFGGSGLGLAISRRLIERMGGKISIASELGRGSIFRFDLLVRTRPSPHSEPVGASDTTRATDAQALPARPLRILIAEDNATNRLVAMRMLERLGHQAIAVANGREAVEAVQSGDYDAILMDVMMPEMDGLAATAAIRALPGAIAAVPIIGLTANALRTDEAACLAAGMNAFATKPISADRLAQAIGRAMAGRGSEPVSGSGTRQSEPPDFDASALERLARDIGAQPTGEIARMFMEHADAHIAAIRGFAAGGQMAELAQKAHALATTARGVGLARVTLAACDLEAAASGGAVQDPHDRIDRLAVLLRDGLTALRSWRPAP